MRGLVAQSSIHLSEHASPLDKSILIRVLLPAAGGVQCGVPYGGRAGDHIAGVAAGCHLAALGRRLRAQARRQDHPQGPRDLTRPTPDRIGGWGPDPPRPEHVPTRGRCCTGRGAQGAGVVAPWSVSSPPALGEKPRLC
jgi:hypothetical protein